MGLGNHFRGHVQTDDLSVRSHLLSCQKRIEARPATEIEDRLSRFRLVQRERVADAAK